MLADISLHIFEFVCDPQVVLSGNHDQDIKFEAFDKDLNSDDFLGR